VLLIATGFSLPLITASPGVSLLDRQNEVKEAAENIKRAKTIVVNGGGLIGVELAGDIRCAYKDKKVVLLSRSDVLKERPLKQRLKIMGAIEAMNVTVLQGEAIGVPEMATWAPGTLTVDSTAVQFDAYIPAFSTGPNTGFLAGSGCELDTRRRMVVNKFLQSSSCKDIFGIGITDVDEPWIGMPKLENQWKTAAKNAVAFLAGGALVAHNEGMPGMTRAPTVKVGNGKGGWALVDFEVLPVPAQVCCCCGYCGTCCGTICCTCCPCGWCCCPAEGQGPAHAFEPFAFTSAKFHFKGIGSANSAPDQKSM